MPVPPFSVSRPVPPTSRSAPPRPWSASSPAPPLSLFGPLWPTTVIPIATLTGTEISWPFELALTTKLSAVAVGFELCGGVCRFANARAEGDKVMLSGDGQPVDRVRYAWAAWPQGANLINAEGLPASCFRTDDFLPSTLGVTSPFKEATAVGN